MKKLLVLTTGGTLDKVYFDALSEFQVGEPVVGDVLKEMNVAFEYEVIEICRKDSLELTDEDRAQLKARIEVSDAEYVSYYPWYRHHGSDSSIHWRAG